MPGEKQRRRGAPKNSNATRARRLDQAPASGCAGCRKPSPQQTKMAATSGGIALLKN